MKGNIQINSCLDIVFRTRSALRFFKISVSNNYGTRQFCVLLIFINLYSKLIPRFEYRLFSTFGNSKSLHHIYPKAVPTERHPKSHRAKAVMSLKAPKFLTQWYFRRRGLPWKTLRSAADILFEDFYPWEIQTTARMAWLLKLFLNNFVFYKSFKYSYLFAWVSIDIKYCTFGINLFRSTCLDLHTMAARARLRV